MMHATNETELCRYYVSLWSEGDDTGRVTGKGATKGMSEAGAHTQEENSRIIDC